MLLLSLFLSSTFSVDGQTIGFCTNGLVDWLLKSKSKQENKITKRAKRKRIPVKTIVYVCKLKNRPIFVDYYA